MSSFLDAVIPLQAIVWLSPLNPRQDMESDVSSLAATIRARGLLQPVLVREIPGEDRLYEVLDGGRRWRAMRSLYITTDEFVSSAEISVRVFSGTDSEAREAAIAVSVTQKPLHPVDEYEAFAALEAGGFSIADIARDFAQSETQIKQRLALGQLSPRVLALWREGTIDREQAQAFTCGPIAAQEAVLDERLASNQLQVYAIRSALRSTALPAHSAVGKFLRADPARVQAYLDAGGRIETDLFEGGEIILDAALAESLADKLLLAEAEKIMEAEGWGGARIASDSHDPKSTVNNPDVTEKEKKRLDEIAKTRFHVDRDACAALEVEEEAILARAILRTVRKKDRANLAVRAELDSAGNLYFVRAVPMCGAVEGDAGDDDGASADRNEAPAPKGKKPKAPEPPPPPEPGAGMAEQARRVLDAAQLQALREATRENVNLALTIAVAALGSCRGGEGLTGRPAGTSLKATILWPIPPRSDLLCAIGEMRFDKALAACLKAEYSELLNTFAELVAGSIDTDKCDWKDVLPLLDAAARRANMAAALRAAFDYREYFLSAGKEAAVEAIRALDGEAAANAAGKLKKTPLADRAAILARDKGWLPEELLAAIGAKPEPAKKEDKRTTAQAMAEAIDDDEARKQAVARFVETVDFPDGGVKASLLYIDFVAWGESQGLAPVSVIAFSAALEANGIAKKRTKAGVHYLGPRQTEAAQ